MQVSSFVGLKSTGRVPHSTSMPPPLAIRPKRSFSSRQQVCVKAYKVAVLGAAGGIGQPLCLLLKMSPYVTKLALYDIANTPGVAADLSHCNTKPLVKGYLGEEGIGGALENADLVVIPAGVPRKPGMTRDDLFNINAGIVKSLVESVAATCPSAVVHIISNPVNSTVAIASEVMKAAGVYDPKKIIGVTALDVVRANTFIAEAKGVDVKDVDVPVIGGHAGITILPLLSQVYPAIDFTDEEIKTLTTRIQEAGTEVVKAKAGAGSATLSMAFAAARMVESTLMALNGERTFECAFVASNVSPLPYFASKIMLGPNGVEQIPSLPDLSDFEKEGFDNLIPELQKSIEKGVNFVKESAPVTA